MSALPQQRHTPEQYLEMDRKAEHRSEYVSGEILATAGGSEKHSLIAVNLSGELRARLKSQPCRTFSSDMRIQISATGAFGFPDVSVVCGETHFAGSGHDLLLNPNVVVEVLSPSAESHDRGWKFAHYRQLESLSDYLLISQSEPSIEHYARQEDGRWVLTELRGLEAIVYLSSLGCELPLSEIYERVEFAPQLSVQEHHADNQRD